MMDKLTIEEGMRFLPLIQTIFLSRKDDFSPDPFSNRQLRHRCFFKKTRGKNKEMIIYFHLHEGEIPPDLFPLPVSINLYGAHNQTSICQMRSCGRIREMNGKEKTAFLDIMNVRLNGKPNGDPLRIKLSFAEMAKARRLMESGKFFRFEPLDYAYDTYEIV